MQKPSPFFSKPVTYKLLSSLTHMLNLYGTIQF